MPGARARVLVSGRVQGVFFRASAADIAAAYRLTGWVRNLSDGRVEAVFEGDKESIRSAIDWCYEGPPAAEVSGVEVFWEDPTGEFAAFEQRHTF